MLCEKNFILLSTILKILSFHSFKALHSTLSRLHHRLPKSFKADAISSLYLLKSIWEGNLYFGPFEAILRIRESGITFKCPVITRPADWYINLESLQSLELGALAWMSRSDTSLLKLKIMFLIGLLIKLLVQFGLLSVHLLGNSCPLG